MTVTENNATYNRTYNFNEGVTGDLTLKALWIAHGAHKVTFYSVEGGSDPEPRSSANVYDGETITAPTTPQGPPGLTFNGWFEFELINNYPGYRITSDAAFDFETAITKDYILIPGWYIHQYTIEFDINNGDEGSVDEIVAGAFDEGMEFDPSSVKRTGYYLAGWSLVKDGDVDFTDTITRPLSKTDDATITLYAKWIKIHDVEFKLDDTHSITVQVLDGNKVSKISNIPEKDPTDTESYEFAGWSLDGENAYDFDATVGQDLTLVPLWNVIPRYVVSFYSIPGGSTPILQYSVIVTKGSTVNEPEDPESPAGLVFKGWYGFDFNNNSSGFVVDGTEFDFTAPILTKTNIIAQWEPYHYTIKFNSNGGSGSINDMTSLAYGAPTIIPNAQVTKEGYHLIGWSLTSDGDVRFTDKISGILSNENDATINLYAIWEINSYTVKFVDSYAQDQTVTHGGKATQPTSVTKDSHKFDDWYSDENRTTKFDFNTAITSDTFVYAKWIRQYTVTFEPSNGTMDEQEKTKTVDEGSKVSQPVISRADINVNDTTVKFTFDGWFIAGGSNSGTQFDFSTPVNSDLTLVARWSSTSLVQVQYYSNVGGGNNIALVNVDLIVAGGQTTGPVLSDRFGMHFDGWSRFHYEGDNIVRDGLVNFASATFDTNTSLIATWSSYTHTVQFDQNYGDGNTIIQTIPNYKVMDSSITWTDWKPTRAGYTLEGWSLSSTGDAEYTTSVSGVLGDAPNNSAVTLYAVWKIEEYTLTLNYNDGLYNGAPVQSKYTVVSDDIVLPTAINLQKDHYTFKGWYDNSGFTGEPVLKVSNGSTGNKTFYAKWDLTEYLITFITNNGSFDLEYTVPTSYTFQSENVTLPTTNDISWAGHTFGGWYSDKALTNGPITTIPSSSEGDKMYYAKWTLTAYPITYENNGGTFIDGSLVKISYNIDDGEILLPAADNISRDGYEFKGWYDNQGYDGDPIPSISKNATGPKTFYAKWTPIEYEINYNTNGGEFATNYTPVSAYTKETTTFDLPTAADVTKTGYEFKGWYDNQDCIGDAITEIEINTIGDKTLYAKWTTIGYTITYNTNGGSFSSGFTPTSAYTKETATFSLPTSANIGRTGYTFNGWYDGNVKVTQVVSGSTGNMTLTAHWSIIDYTISYNVNGGVFSNGYNKPVSYNITSSDITLPTSSDITRSGFAFLGWYETPNGATTVIPHGSTGDRTFTAQWAAVDYLIDYVVNGGVYSEGYYPVTGYSATDGDITLPTSDDIKREGYDFLGWFEYGSTTKLTKIYTDSARDYTVYAEWQIKSYTVKIVPDNGTVIQDQSVTYNQCAVEPARLVKDGFMFVGWFSDQALTESFDFDTPIKGDLTVYAKWIEEYTVSFETDGGDAIPSQKIVKGGNATEPAQPTKDLHRFIGWFVDSVPFSFDTPITGDITVTAKWIRLYTVTFNSNGGTPVESQTVDSGANALTPVNPQRDGYTFGYWHAVGQSTPYDFTSPVTGDLTLIAQWTSNNTPTPVDPTPVDPTPVDPTPVDPTPIDPTPIDPTPDHEREVINNDDGSQTVIEKKTEKDESGTTTETTTETTTKQDGSKTEDISKTITEEDGSKESVDQHTVIDSDGNVIERENTITITDPSGKQETIVVKGDRGSIRIWMPDMELTTLYKAIEYVTDYNASDVTLVFDSDLGYIIIPAPYLDEVSKVGYHICLVSKIFDITLDRDVVKYLSEDTEDAKLWIREAALNSLTDEQRKIVGDNFVLYLALDLGDRHISDLNGFAHIMISTDKAYNHAYHVSNDGQIEEVGCSYDKDTKCTTITLSHFSIYTLTVGQLEVVEEDGDDSSFVMIAAIGAIAIIALLIVVAVAMRRL